MCYHYLGKFEETEWSENTVLTCTF